MDKIDYYYKNAINRIHQTQEGDELLDIDFIYKDIKSNRLSRKMASTLLSCVPISILESMVPTVNWQNFYFEVKQNKIDHIDGAHVYFWPNQEVISIGKRFLD